MNSFFRAIGGRKQLNGYLYAALVTFMALRMDGATFDAYALWLAVALLGTSAAVVIEDKARMKAGHPPEDP